MSHIFISYSGRNSNKVTSVVRRLSEEFGSDAIWYAKKDFVLGEDIESQLSNAIQSASLFLNFETSITARLPIQSVSRRARLGRRNRLLLYEREEAIRNKIPILNIALFSPRLISSSFSEFQTIDFTRPINSVRGESSLRKLIQLIEEQRYAEGE